MFLFTLSDFFITILGVSLCVMIGIMGCERRAASHAQPPSTLVGKEAPAQESWGTHVNIYENGHPRMTMQAGHLSRFEREDSTYTLLQPRPDRKDGRVAIFLYDANGDTSTTIHADRVYYYNDERRFDARGHVIATTSNDKRLETKHLRWDEHTSEVRAPGFVRIITPRDSIEGYTLRGDEHLDHYRIANVTGKVTLK